MWQRSQGVLRSNEIVGSGISSPKLCFILNVEYFHRPGWN